MKERTQRRNRDKTQSQTHTDRIQRHDRHKRKDSRPPSSFLAWGSSSFLVWALASLSLGSFSLSTAFSVSAVAPSVRAEAAWLGAAPHINKEHTPPATTTTIKIKAAEEHLVPYHSCEQSAHDVSHQQPVKSQRCKAPAVCRPPRCEPC